MANTVVNGQTCLEKRGMDKRHELLEKNLKEKHASDVGWALAELARLTMLLKAHGRPAAKYQTAAKKQADQLTALGYGNLPICVAKTQYSFSDDPTKLGAPKGFTVSVRNLKVCAGAGFIVALTGDIMTMPGLPKVPAAENIDVDENGRITGLF